MQKILKRLKAINFFFFLTSVIPFFKAPQAIILLTFKRLNCAHFLISLTFRNAFTVLFEEKESELT